MSTSKCLRCGAVCATMAARAAVRAVGEGYCTDCVATGFILGLEPITAVINGTPARGKLVGARAGRGPELFLDRHWREFTLKPAMATVLANTQLKWEKINWVEVVGNWGMPWPK